jgi:hypothetical protein
MIAGGRPVDAGSPETPAGTSEFQTFRAAGITDPIAMATGGAE